MATPENKSTVFVLVVAYGFFVGILGYGLGVSTSRAILGMMAFSPASLTIWIPFVGFFAFFGYWPFVGFLLTNVKEKANHLTFIAIMLAHYGGIVLIATWDLSKPVPAQELRHIWAAHPTGMVWFAIFYTSGQLAIWSYCTVASTRRCAKVC